MAKIQVQIKIQVSYEIVVQVRFPVGSNLTRSEIHNFWALLVFSCPERYSATSKVVAFGCVVRCPQNTSNTSNYTGEILERLKMILRIFKQSLFTFQIYTKETNLIFKVVVSYCTLIAVTSKKNSCDDGKIYERYNLQVIILSSEHSKIETNYVDPENKDRDAVK